ncbi:MAG: DUF1924 domain-containing protein [Zoogloeaceae bacterium]|nr:DUF1924 domain-containing protein [Rhodocyclaceae bacterium]MCP5234251.1 DUF1924 domain-containing protein [Zoogloeaceae bacterium]
METIRACVVVVAATVAAPAWAERPSDFLRRFEAEARISDAAFNASAERGRNWFESRHGRDWSCSTCHTKDPAASGRHEVTGKLIDPMAPDVNAERLRSARQVGKWFRRNCKDVLGRECSAAEKADVVAWLIAAGRSTGDGQ